MSTGRKPVGWWGVALIAVALGGGLGFGLDPLPALLLAGAGTAAVVTALASSLSGPGEGAADAAPPGRSGATLVALAGFVLAVVGAVFGQLLLFPGLALLVLGLVLVRLELHAERTA